MRLVRRKVIWGYTKPPFGSRIDYSDPINRGLIGYWAGLDDGGKRLTDLTGHSHGTVQSGATWSVAKFGRTLNYNGSTGYTSIPNYSLIPTTGAIGVSFWMNQRTRTDGVLSSIFAITATGGAKSFDVSFATSGGTTYLFSDSVAFSATITGAQIPSLNAWHHVILDWDPATTNLTYYLDGVYVTGYSGVSLSTVPASIEIGRRTNAVTGYSDALIDNVRLYNRSLLTAGVTNAKPTRLFTEPYAGIIAPRRRIVSLVASSATSASIAATESSDTAAITAANWTAAQVAATESSDTAAIAAAATTPASIAATESSDTAAVTASATTGASIVASESTDTAAVTAANWTTADIAATEASDTTAIAATVTTGAAIAASESSDTADLLAAGNAGVTSAFVDATESSDTAALVATGGTADIPSTAAAGGVPRKKPRRGKQVADDAFPSPTLRIVTTASIAATESSDTCAITVEQFFDFSKDAERIAALADKAAYEGFLRRLEIEADDNELMEI